jgi:mRNA interferase HigB
MHIRGRQIIRDFIKKYPMARTPLKRWEAIVQAVEWTQPADVKQTYGSASFIGRTTVFNIGGNKWRLLSHILYKEETVVVVQLATHRAYDKLKIR